MMRRGFLFLLLIPVTSFSQYNYKADTSCYSSQYIAIPNDSIHRVLFDTTHQMDLFHTVYYLNRKHLLDVYAEEDFIASCCVGLFTDYRLNLSADSTQHIFHDYEMLWDVEIYGFLNNAAYREPLRNENYEYIEIVDAQGNYSWTYPEIDTTYFGFVSIPEIRIEERMITEDDFDWFDETGMRIDRFGFTAFDYSARPELFWVDFDLFRIALEKSDLKKENLPWYDMLFNRSYGGFRYRQTACDDAYDR